MEDIDKIAKLRLGQGYDLHPLVPGSGFKLGGVLIKCDKQATAHSDGDALLHAICDAILGGAAMGDIGQHFPDSDERWRDVDSAELVKQTLELIRQRGYRVINLDCTVLLESPMLAPYNQEMRDNICALLDLAQDQVNIKATRGEGLDAIGRGEAVAVHCNCLLYRL